MVKLYSAQYYGPLYSTHCCDKVPYGQRLHQMTDRRETDPVITSMSQDIGYMRGRLDSYIDTSDKILNRLASNYNNIERRTRSLESTRDKGWGVMAALSLSGGGLAALLAKIFGV